MKHFTKFIRVAIVAILPFIYSSCDKIDLGEAEDYDVSLEEVKSVVYTEALLNVTFVDVFNMGIRAGAFADIQLNSMPKKSGNVVDVLGGQMEMLIIDNNPNLPATIRLDWGDENKKGSDGFNRRGMMVATLSNYWSEANSKISIEFRNYYFNDYKVEGEVTFTNLGSNLYNVYIKDGKVTSTDSKIAKRNSDIFLKWIEGVDTKMDITDDIWGIYGVVGGTTATGLDYVIDIKEDKYLEKATVCKHPNKGVASFLIKAIKFSLDYSPDNEECDSKAELDFYGLKKQIDFDDSEG
jgi:hypothetical protein